jgi:hypothetical protein
VTTLTAGELRADMVLIEHDWRLHVQSVSVADTGRVAIQTTEFPGFALHRAADELVAIEPTRTASDVSRTDAQPDNENDEITARAA